MYYDFHFNYKFDSDFGKYSAIPSHLKKRTPRYPHYLKTRKCPLCFYSCFAKGYLGVRFSKYEGITLYFSKTEVKFIIKVKVMIHGIIFLIWKSMLQTRVFLLLQIVIFSGTWEWQLDLTPWTSLPIYFL